MIVKVPVGKYDGHGGFVGGGFRFFCLCGSSRFVIETTEDPTVPLFTCANCDATVLVPDLEAAPVEESPP